MRGEPARRFGSDVGDRNALRIGSLGAGIKERSRNSSTSVNSGPQGVLPMQFLRQGRCARQIWVATNEHPRHPPIAPSHRQLRMRMFALRPKGIRRDHAGTESIGDPSPQAVDQRRSTPSGRRVPLLRSPRPGEPDAPRYRKVGDRSGSSCVPCATDDSSSRQGIPWRSGP